MSGNLTAAVRILNKLPVCALENMAESPNTLRLWIERGRITGFVKQDGGKEKLHKIEEEIENAR